MEASHHPDLQGRYLRKPQGDGFLPAQAQDLRKGIGPGKLGPLTGQGFQGKEAGEDPFPGIGEGEEGFQIPFFP